MITGANGNLGRRLALYLLSDHRGGLVSTPDEIHLVVRSDSAREVLQALPLSEAARQRVHVHVLSYTDVQTLHQVAQQCDRVVHLVGILKASRRATYADAHEGSCRALVDAVKSSPVKHITYMSIVGADSRASNKCLRSKGVAEEVLLASPVATCVLRVPMVLGEGDYASSSLAAKAASAVNFGFRASSLEQPIYAGDVVHAITCAGDLELNAQIDLGGPESLSRSALIQRAAKVLNHSTRNISLPLFLGLALAWVFERLLANPPVTVAMLDVLDHDDHIDVQAGMDQLQLGKLTSLDDMLGRVLLA